ncbi:hypothetical protein D3C73_1024390 [compost metagenome]
MQALGQVAVAAGNRLEHLRHAVDWPGHARRRQPDQQQAEQPGRDGHQHRLDRTALLGVIEHRLQLHGVGQ